MPSPPYPPYAAGVDLTHQAKHLSGVAKTGVKAHHAAPQGNATSFVATVTATAAAPGRWHPMRSVMMTPRHLLWQTPPGPAT